MGNANLTCTKNDLIECDVVYGIGALFCVTCAALAAGMTMGLLSLDQLKLKIKLAVGTTQEKQAAIKILPIISNHHLLLCTLLLFNSVANEALPIFLNELVPSWAAVLISVTLILLFGEILPTALFTGPSQLIIASKFTSLVYFLQLLFWPIAYPMSIALDNYFGIDESEMYNRDEISAMVHLHSRSGYSTAYDPSSVADDGTEEEAPLNDSEVEVITGVLGLAKKTTKDVYIPWDKVNILSSDQILDNVTIEAIDKVGHSRLPVCQGSTRTHIIGYLLVKKLININPEKAIPLMSLSLNDPLIVDINSSLLNVLKLFQSGHSHLALVSKNPDLLLQYYTKKETPTENCAPVGILTLEDIIEAMIQSQIFDEEDIEKSVNYASASLNLQELSYKTQPHNNAKKFNYDVEKALLESIAKDTNEQEKMANNKGRMSEGSIRYTHDEEDDLKKPFITKSKDDGELRHNVRITPALVTKYVRNRHQSTKESSNNGSGKFNSTSNNATRSTRSKSQF